MNLTQTDRIIISAALSTKADFINDELKKNPNDEFWMEKLEGVKTAYKNFNDRELLDD
jgi:hypothetical protein|tara:strand:+ start:230 stop:403 length:174 start_codon:yes stop_codon:yes gene_type:complete